MTWLDRTPRGVVRAHLRVLPRLQAEESLRESQRIAVGTGNVSKDARSRILNEWSRAAVGDQAARTLRTAKDGKAMLAGVGIGLHKVKAR